MRGIHLDLVHSGREAMLGVAIGLVRLDHRLARTVAS